MQNSLSKNEQPIVEDSENLGKSIKFFLTRNLTVKRCLALIGGILFILASLAGTAFLSIRALQAIQSHGRSILGTRLPFILLILLVLPLGILLIFWAKRHWKDGITVYEHGFTRQRNKKTETWLWTEVDQLDTRIIRSVFGGSEVNSRIEISLEAQNHPSLNIKHKYNDMTELAQIIRNNTLPVLYQKLLPLLADKEHTLFNTHLELDIRGIMVNQNQMDWKDIDAVETQKGNLIFKANKQNDVQIKIPLNHIKNLDLLLFIIHNPGLRENLASK